MTSDPSPTVLLLHGPNLNLIGSREPEVYGTATLDADVGAVERIAAELDLTVEAHQSNHEGDLVDSITGLGIYGYELAVRADARLVA